jgi:hypothetical protein
MTIFNLIKDIALTSFWGLCMGFGVALAVFMPQGVGRSRIEKRQKEHPEEYRSISQNDIIFDGYKSFVGLLAIAIYITVYYLISSNPYELNLWALIPSTIVGFISGTIVFVSRSGKEFAFEFGVFVQDIWEYVAAFYLPPTKVFRNTSEKWKEHIAEKRLEFLDSVQTLEAAEKDAIREIVQETVCAQVVPLRTKKAITGWVNFLCFLSLFVVSMFPEKFFPIQSYEQGLLNWLIVTGLLLVSILVIHGPFYVSLVAIGDFSNWVFLLLYLAWPAVVIACVFTFLPKLLSVSQQIPWISNNVLLVGVYLSFTLYVVTVLRAILIGFLSFAHSRYMDSRFPQVVAIQSLLNLVSWTEKANEAWSSISMKRYLIGQIEDAARSIAIYFPKQLRMGNSKVDSHFQSVTRRFASKLRDLKWFIVMPSDDSETKLARQIADILIHVVNGNWQYGEDGWVLLPKVNSHGDDRLVAKRNWRQLVTNFGLKVIIAVLPLSVLWGVEAMTMIPNVPILWKGLAILWSIVIILMAIDPQFDDHLSAFRKAVESILPKKGVEES